MTTVETSDIALEQAPKLRLLPQAGNPVDYASAAARPQLRVVNGPAAIDKPVLLVGADASTCAAMQHDLASKMPKSTRFDRAFAIWEMLVRARHARMVVLSGALEDIPAESLLQMLAHRHPEIPLVCVEAEGDRSTGQTAARVVKAVAR